MYKGFKIRIYPTKKQEELFWKHIHACRYIWNYMLDLQEKRYNANEKHLSTFSMVNLITGLKRDGEHDWLKEVSRHSLDRVCKDLDHAYQQMFDKISRTPRFKSKKKSKPKYPVRSESMYFHDRSILNIEKVGRVKYKSDIEFPTGNRHLFDNVRVSYEGNRWFLCFVMESENQVSILTDKLMGIDLGVKELAVVAIDEKQLVFHNINKSQKVRMLDKKQRHLKRSISRKYEKNKHGKVFVKTKNIERAEEKLRKIYRRITNIRRNHIHQTTHALVSMLPERVVMEDLKVSNMLRNKHLARAISEQCFYEFRRQMQYKCEWKGIEFVQADRFYPSSKTCSCCGNIKKNQTLKDRVYECDVCGIIIDRDFNAALNLSRYMA